MSTYSTISPVPSRSELRKRPWVSFREAAEELRWTDHEHRAMLEAVITAMSVADHRLALREARASFEDGFEVESGRDNGWPLTVDAIVAFAPAAMDMTREWDIYFRLAKVRK
jgi:hypothetical protein